MKSRLHNIEVLMETKRLVLEKFKKEDFEDYFRLVGNEDVMKMISGKPITREVTVKRFEDILAINGSNPEIGYFHIKKKETYEFIGLGKIVMTGNREAEIGYSLLPENWNMGYGSEISEILVKYSRSIDYIDSLMAITDPENMASKKILEKSNFVLDEVCTLDNLPAEIYKLKLDNAER